MALLGKNKGEYSIEDALAEKKIPFAKKDLNLFGFSVTWAYEFQYVKDGQNRWAYEVNFRIEIDDYVIVSYVFDAPESIQSLKKYFENN